MVLGRYLQNLGTWRSAHRSVLTRAPGRTSGVVPPWFGGSHFGGSGILGNTRANYSGSIG